MHYMPQNELFMKACRDLPLKSEQKNSNENINTKNTKMKIGIKDKTDRNLQIVELKMSRAWLR
jgi:hypothetical protein